MNILLTNDDGIYAEGIAELYRSLKRVGTVTVVAPDREQSSVGHGITLSHPIWIKKVNRRKNFKGYGISGTPADCVKFAIRVLLKQKPDIVVSGINLGSNDGCSVFYSGTVAGAREGALMGIPSVAISLATFVNPDFRYAAIFGAKLVKMLNRHKMSPGTFLNVNVPHLKPSKIKGVRVTRQGTDPLHGEFRKRIDPHLREYYWMTGRLSRIKKDIEVDTYALQRGYVTVTPIHCDMTEEKALEDIKRWKMPRV
jgi:5'-nucleotidase